MKYIYLLHTHNTFYSTNLTQFLCLRWYLLQVGSWIQATVRLEKLSGSRASFSTQCLLLPQKPSLDDSLPDATNTVHTAGPVLIEGQAFAILRNIPGLEKGLSI